MTQDRPIAPPDEPGAPPAEPLSPSGLLPLVYTELRGLAERSLRADRPGHTWQPTALVNEVYLKLLEQKRVNWRGRDHFMGVAAEAMKRLLIDHARAHRTAKRGGNRVRVALAGVDLADIAPEAPVEDLADALEELEKLDARALLLVELRFFAGMNVEQAAAHIGVSHQTAERDWRFAKAWLRRRLEGEPTDAG